MSGARKLLASPALSRLQRETLIQIDQAGGCIPFGRYFGLNISTCRALLRRGLIRCASRCARDKVSLTVAGTQAISLESSPGDVK